MADADRYSIVIRRVEIDGELMSRATVRELPDVAVFEDSHATAYSAVLEIISGLRDDALAEGRSFPDPLNDEDEFTGRITLRMPPSLHRQISSLADSDKTSLNQYIVQILTATVCTASLPPNIWATAGLVGKQLAAQGLQGANPIYHFNWLTDPAEGDRGGRHQSDQYITFVSSAESVATADSSPRHGALTTFHGNLKSTSPNWYLASVAHTRRAR